MGKFALGEKATKQEAINKLVLKISEYFDGRYELKFGSDDGGSILNLYVEVPEPSVEFEKQVTNFPPLFDIIPKWMGWRCVLTKVPPGYVDAVINRTDWDAD